LDTPYVPANGEVVSVSAIGVTSAHYSDRAEYIGRLVKCKEARYNKLSNTVYAEFHLLDQDPGYAICCCDVLFVPVSVLDNLLKIWR
jgi:hypothetical protein